MKYLLTYVCFPATLPPTSVYTFIHTSNLWVPFFFGSIIESASLKNFLMQIKNTLMKPVSQRKYIHHMKREPHQQTQTSACLMKVLLSEELNLPALCYAHFSPQKEMSTS